MTDSKEPWHLLRLPGELRDRIWGLIAKSERANGESTRGIINCCRQTASEMAPHVIPFNSKGGLKNLTIRFDVTLVNNVWLTLDFSAKRRNISYSFPLGYHNYIASSVGRSCRIENMDNPILDAVRKATYIKRVQVVFGEEWFPIVEPPGKCLFDSALPAWAPSFPGCTWESQFLVHFAKAMDAARLVSSLNIAEELTFKRGHLRNDEKADIFYYLESTPLANQAAVTPASLPWSSGPLSACREPGPHTLDERSFGVIIRSLSTVTASELLVGAFLLEGNRPVCPYPAYIFVNPMGRLDVTIANEWGFSWAMGGYVDMEKLEELNVDLKDRYQDLRRLERLDVGWEGRYLNLHRIMGRSGTQLVDFKQVLDAYASALRQAERSDNPTPDIRSLLRHRDATQHTSENNFFYRLLHRKP